MLLCISPLKGIWMCTLTVTSSYPRAQIFLGLVELYLAHSLVMAGSLLLRLGKRHCMVIVEDFLDAKLLKSRIYSGDHLPEIVGHSVVTLHGERGCTSTFEVYQDTESWVAKFTLRRWSSNGRLLICDTEWRNYVQLLLTGFMTELFKSVELYSGDGLKMAGHLAVTLRRPCMGTIEVSVDRDLPVSRPILRRWLWNDRPPGRDTWGELEWSLLRSPWTQSSWNGRAQSSSSDTWGEILHRHCWDLYGQQ